MNCECVTPGMCPIFERPISPHQHRICRGEILTPEKCEEYRQIWLYGDWSFMKDGPRPEPPPPAPQDGPGTELAGILHEAGAKADQCGGVCQAWKDRMNQWGVAGCREHRQEIIDRIKSAMFKTWVADQIRIGWSISREPWFRLDDPVGCIVDEAIRRAETKAAETTAPSPTDS